MNSKSNGIRSATARFSVTTLLAAAAALPGLASVAQQPPVEAFASLPAMESPSISVDGTRIAFITHAEGRDYIFVAKLEDFSVTAAIDVGEAKPRGVTWASDEALVFAAGTTTSLFVIPGRVESTAPYGVDLTGNPEVTRLMRDRGNRGRGRTQVGGGRFAVANAQLIGYQRSEGRVLFPKFDFAEAEIVLIAVDPKTDRQTVVDRGSRNTADWVVDESGAPVFRVDYNQTSNSLVLLGRRDNHWGVLLEKTVEIPELSIFGLDQDGDLVLGTRPEEGDHYGLYKFSTTTGDISNPILTNDSYDVSAVRTDPYTNRVVGAGLPGVGPVWLDSELQEQQKLLNDTFPGESPLIVSWSEDRSRFIVTTESDNRAPAIYLYDARAPSVDQIASAYPALQSVTLARRRPYSFEARDGTEIPGYLTRPVGAEGPTPLVVLPHGGPASRDMPGFDWIAHFLASRGYTVLQPNFRGSGGYGRAWEEAGHGEWGIGVMQHDISDGVAAVIDAGLADPERVCIVGASYGGYAALAGAIFTPELYRCAAAIAPVSDLVDMIGFERDRRGGFSAAVSYWRQAMGGGDPESLKDRLQAASPIAHADQARAPILLIHGRDDSVVPIEQSRSMERALQAAGKSVELIELEGEDHWLSSAPTRIAMLEAVEEFLAEHLGN
jgi:dipeptidyl aminopeptidase/acylaminoacyl peptidase